VVVARELTKLHEELRAGTVLELGDYYSQEAPKGEVTVLLAGTGEPAPPPDRTAEGGRWPGNCSTAERRGARSPNG